MSCEAASFTSQFCQLISHFSSKPKAIGSKSHYSTEFVFPVVCIDQGCFLVKNSFSSFAVPTQEMAVTFPAHKVMHFDRRHRASPSNHAAQTTAHCSPEACWYSCCLITFSRPGAERQSEYQRGRKAVLLILWQSSARSSIQSRLVIQWMFIHLQKCPLLSLLSPNTSNSSPHTLISICQKLQDQLKIKNSRCLLCFSLCTGKWITACDLKLTT